jgi:SulP family sulfate permease
MMAWLARRLPLLGSLSGYDRASFSSDLLAAVIVTVMLIPQSLAYALLAGLPAEMGLYASIVPLLAYALLGTSRTLSVGPVAVISLMTATAVGSVAQSGTADYATAAIAMALLSGAMLVILGFLRFGFLANFLSHPVVSGFITASGILIALSQLRHLLGIDMRGDNLLSLGASFIHSVGHINATTVVVGCAALAILLGSRSGLAPLLQRLGLGAQAAQMLAKAGPILAIALTAIASLLFGLEQRGVAVVGTVPSGLPAFGLPNLGLDLWTELAVPALLISIIGFVESVSVGKTLAARRQQRIDPNRELVALGAANLGSALSGGFPVTGGFSRSVVNYDAGAATQVASILAAIGIALAALFLTPALYYLPKATLAATIMIAVSSLVDVHILKLAWRYSRSDFIAVAITIGITLLAGVELGVLSGILASISLHLHKTSQPHVAVVGAVPGTQHFRNVDRHDVVTHRNLVSLRIDESLYFANASYLETVIDTLTGGRPDLEHVILQCPAVNEIDLSALEVLEDINNRLLGRGIKLHLSEVKGPVMDALQRSDFLKQLSGQVFLTHYQAVQQLKPDDIEPYIP